jgi:phenylalanine-4-hydroxylase
LRVYGAGILSSGGETVHALTSHKPQRLAFDLERVMRTPYRIDDYQDTYFVIRSFAQLFDATAPDFTPLYKRLAALRRPAVERPPAGRGDVPAQSARTAGHDRQPGLTG